MDTQPFVLTRENLAALPVSYFTAVDAMDVDRVVSHFAQGGTFTVPTSQVELTGAAEIRQFFADAYAGEKTIKHELTNVVVDETARAVATEQNYVGELADGTKIAMHNCNFFTVSDDGKFTRVINWAADNQPADA